MYHLMVSLFLSIAYSHKQKHVTCDTELTRSVTFPTLTSIQEKINKHAHNNIHVHVPKVTVISLLFTNAYENLLLKLLKLNSPYLTVNLVLISNLYPFFINSKNISPWDISCHISLYPNISLKISHGCDLLLHPYYSN